MKRNEVTNKAIILAAFTIFIGENGYGILSGFDAEVAAAAKDVLGMTDERLDTIGDIMKETAERIGPILNDCMEDMGEDFEVVDSWGTK